jgi:hypothetical protein
VLLQGSEQGGEVLAVRDLELRRVELRGDVHRRPLEALLVDDDRGPDPRPATASARRGRASLADGRVEVGAAWRSAFMRAAAGRAVGPALAVPRDDAAIGEQTDLPEHRGALDDRAPVASWRWTSSASYCTGRSKHTSTGRSSWRLTMNAERPSANVRAISRGRPSSSTRSAIPPAVVMLIPAACRTTRTAGGGLEHRDPPGVVELVEQQLADRVVVLELDAVLVELLGEAASRS